MLYNYISSDGTEVFVNRNKIMNSIIKPRHFFIVNHVCYRAEKEEPFHPSVFPPNVSIDTFGKSSNSWLEEEKRLKIHRYLCELCW